MLDSSQLPHILKLVDDESETVQRAVAKALAEFGTSLDAELARLSPPPNGRLIQRAHQLVENHERLQNNVQCRADLEPQFHSGQLVQHQRYGYRGVVVDLDLTCQADDDWYVANRTQPDRNQPWYHVLVHNSDQVTYAAQTSLEDDNSLEEVAHPLVPHFFSDFSNGKYLRNDTPWPHS